MIVMKFGGSSIATSTKILHCIELIKNELPRKPIVVVSAHGKITNQLINAAQHALEGEVSIESIVKFHNHLCEELDIDNEVIALLLEQLRAITYGVSLVRELTPRTLDLIMSFGERMSARIIAAALTKLGVLAVPLDACRIGLKTTSDHGRAMPLADVDEEIADCIAKVDAVPVITGFIGKDGKGNITTLGRSGSDFTASIIAAASCAEEVQIWTDVNGVMTCDPTLDPTAESLPVLSFEEASELAYYGAEVLHPNTLIPAIRKGIPVRVLNTQNPNDAGTKIVHQSVLTSSLAKSVVYKEDVSIINIASPRILSAVNLLTQALEIIGRHQLQIHMANTSEATVSLVTETGCDPHEFSGAIDELKSIGTVDVERNKSIICMVGEELKGQAGVLGQIFGAVSAQGVKAKMVSQSASEINVAFVVDNSQIAASVRALHGLILQSKA